MSKPIVHAAFPTEFILKRIGKGLVHKGKHIFTGGKRMRTFQQSLTCCECGIKGNIFMLEQNQGDGTPHLNLYHKRGKRKILMTRDHILPLSLFGDDSLENSQTMCFNCNCKKDNDIRIVS